MRKNIKPIVGLCLFTISAAAWAANEVSVGCGRFRLLLDPRLSPAIVDRDWARAALHTETPAVLELRGCNGQVLDRLTLEAPLARLDPDPLRGTPAPTFLVSVDLTAGAGSYNGPLTIPVQVIHDHLTPAIARTSDRRLEPIRLVRSGKAEWKKDPVGKVDDLLSVSSQPRDGSFITFYRRYHPASNSWQVKIRSEAGLWESDGEFPDVHLFPSFTREVTRNATK